MSTGTEGAGQRRPAEDRAEELMSRVTGQASRMIGRAVGRAREELEDILAEARTLNGGDESAEPPAPARPRSRSADT